MAINLAKYQWKEVEKVKQIEDFIGVRMSMSLSERQKQWSKGEGKEGSSAESGVRGGRGDKKHSRDEPIKITETMGSYLIEHDMQWMVKEGVVCNSCKKWFGFMGEDM